MNSFLITCGNSQDRLGQAKKLLAQRGLKIKNWPISPDLLIIRPEPSIGIGQIRALQKFLSRRPYQSAIRAVFIPEAEKMTLPSQNAFLKTLEEPPENSLIILCSQNRNQLLSTIISRCQIINLSLKPQIKIDQKTIDDYFSFFKTLINNKIGQRFKLIEPYTTNRDKAIQFCQKMIIALHRRLKPSSLAAISQFQSALNLLEANVNVRLTLENLVINLSS